MVPWLWRHGFGRLKTGRIGAYLFRSSISVISMMCGFTALGYMPIANATSLSFTAPLFATILAVLILKEKVRLRRWTATLLGFAGAMIVLQPGASGRHRSGRDAGRSSAAFLTGDGHDDRQDAVAQRKLAGDRHLYGAALHAARLHSGFLLLDLAQRRLPGPSSSPSASSARMGHLCWTRALCACADASAVVPYDYSRLIFTTGIGMVWFGEQPDHWFWVGSVVIIGAGLYIAQREAVLRRTRATAAVATQTTAENAQAGGGGN